MAVRVVDRSSRVGFVGLGNLGEPMARTLLRAGWSLTVLDQARHKADRCAAEGAGVAESPRELHDCQVVALAVPDNAAVDDVLHGDEHLLDTLPSGATVVVHSTVLPDSLQRLAATAARRGVGVVDAPVSGGADRAATGDLTVMAGGAPEVVDAVRPLLDTVGSDVRHVGPPGAGAATKLANQLMMFAALAGTYEALDLAAAYGVEEADVLAAVDKSTGGSWVTRHWGFFDQVAQAYDEGGTLVRDRPWSKDLAEVVAAARAADVALPVAGLLAQYIAERVERRG
ncbi:MAG: NAD(P)-dependent oxidoreductase [Actinomycetes bacterium]